MTIVRVGSNDKYANGWDAAFGKGKKGAAATAKKKPSKAVGKKGKKGKK